MATWKEPKSDYTAMSPVTPDIFNGLAENEKYLNDVKIGTGEVQNANVTSTVPESRTNLLNTEQLKIALGKIRKWFADLGTLAFKSRVSDADITDVSHSKVTGLGALAVLNKVGDEYITEMAGSKNVGAVPMAVADANGNIIVNTYLTKLNPAMNGALSIKTNDNKIQYGSYTPSGYNMGVAGILLTSIESSDEGGLLITGDGAYLYNSSDSGSILRCLDEDVWVSQSGAKKDCTFTNGLMFDLTAAGDVKIKGKFYQNNGAELVGSGSIAIVPNPNLGNATTLQAALDYIANVFGGTQTVKKLKANTFDAV